MKGVEIELDGKMRKLTYNHETIADMEEAMGGVSALALLSQERLGFHSIRMFVMYGLRREEKGITRQRVGMMLQKYYDDGGTFEKLIEVVMDALKLSGVFGKEAIEELGNVEGAE